MAGCWLQMGEAGAVQAGRLATWALARGKAESDKSTLISHLRKRRHRKGSGPAASSSGGSIWTQLFGPFFTGQHKCRPYLGPSAADLLALP